MSDTLGHVDIQQTIQAIKHLLRQYKLDLEGYTLGGGGLDSSLLASDTTRDDISSVGADYSSWDPSATVTFTSMVDRFEAIDMYLGSPLSIAFLGDAGPDGTVSNGGHIHSGVNWDGPKVPAQSISAPEGSLNADENFAAHVLDAKLHPLNESLALQLGVFDPFDNLDNWVLTTGSAVVADNALKISSGSILRLKAPHAAWTDSMTVDLDMLQTSEFTQLILLLRTGDTVGYSLLVQLKTGGTGPGCTVGIWRHSDNTIFILGSSPSGESAVSFKGLIHFRIILHGDKLIVTNSGGPTAKCSIFSVGSLDGAAVPWTGGDVKIIVWPTDKSVTLKTIALMHLPDLDASDMTDFLNRYPSSGAVTRHAATHYNGKSDALEAQYLGDSDGRMLTGGQRTALTNNPSMLDMHYHYDYEVDLVVDGDDPVVGGDTNLHEHVNNADVHTANDQLDSGDETENLSTWDAYGPDIASGTPPLPAEISSDLAGNLGAGSVDKNAACVEHTHTIPYWMLAIGYDNMNYLNHFCSKYEMSVSANQHSFPSPWPVRFPKITLNGELYLDTATSNLGDTSFDGTIHCEARIRVHNSGSPICRYFKASGQRANAWVGIHNTDYISSSGPFYPGLWSHKFGLNDDDSQISDTADTIIPITLPSGTTDIYVFVTMLSRTSFFSLLPILGNVGGDLAPSSWEQSSGTVTEGSLFHGPDPHVKFVSLLNLGDTVSY